MKRTRTWGDLTLEQKQEVIDDLHEAVRQGRAAIDFEYGPPVVFDPKKNPIGWEPSDWKKMNEDDRAEAGGQWFLLREIWPA